MAVKLDKEYIKSLEKGTRRSKVVTIVNGKLQAIEVDPNNYLEELKSANEQLRQFEEMKRR
jgi:hypothetical protein